MPHFDAIYREMVEPMTCGVCTKCFRYLSGRRKGQCIHGGPYLGYVHVEPSENAEPEVPQENSGNREKIPEAYSTGNL